MGSEPDATDTVAGVGSLGRALGNVTVVLKGPQDTISDGNNSEPLFESHYYYFLQELCAVV